MDYPLLSVCLITYNHVKYIKDAIEGVLMQKVNFSWELIIADDFSTDGTREIVLEYKEKYPEFIKLILQEKNVGACKNWLDLLAAPKSKYIAYFEGDDYWTDPLKLKKQVDFFEANPNYVLCGHASLEVDENGVDLLRPPWGPNKVVLEQKDSLFGCLFHTSSFVFKRDSLFPLPKFLYKVAGGDDALCLHILRKGKAYYFPEKMSCYRIHNGGTWSAQRSIIKDLKMLHFAICASREYLGFKSIYKDHIKTKTRVIEKSLKRSEIRLFIIEAFKLDATNIFFIKAILEVLTRKLIQSFKNRLKLLFFRT